MNTTYNFTLIQIGIFSTIQYITNQTTTISKLSEIIDLASSDKGLGNIKEVIMTIITCQKGWHSSATH